MPFSPTHEVDWRADGGRLTVRSECRPPGDFELLLPIRRGLLGTTVVTHAPGGDDRYAMIVLSPPAVRAETVLPRDLTLVVDVSGSMAGDKIEQAKAAVRMFLRSLRPGDLFQVVTFASAVQTFFDKPQLATEENLASALQRVDRLAAMGGTNISGALQQALEAAIPLADDGGVFLPQIVFVTDGQPTMGLTNPQQILDLTKSADRRSTRVFET